MYRLTDGRYNYSSLLKQFWSDVLHRLAITKNGSLTSQSMGRLYRVTAGLCHLYLFSTENLCLHVANTHKILFENSHKIVKVNKYSFLSH